MDWKAAEQHLAEVESAYCAIGRAGTFGLMHVIAPLRVRFNNGERTQALYDEILALE